MLDILIQIYHRHLIRPCQQCPQNTQIERRAPFHSVLMIDGGSLPGKDRLGHTLQCPMVFLDKNSSFGGNDGTQMEYFIKFINTDIQQGCVREYIFYIDKTAPILQSEIP